MGYGGDVLKELLTRRANKCAEDGYDRDSALFERARDRIAELERLLAEAEQERARLEGIALEARANVASPERFQ